MFTEKVTVRKLRPSEVNVKAVDDINYLLRRQHSKTRKVDKESLLAHMKQSKVVVAWNDDDRIIALGVLVRTYALSHTFAGIHNLIIRNGFNPLSIGKRIVDLLIDEVDDVEFIETGVWPENNDLINLLTVSGFVPKSKLRYRRKC